MDEGGGLMLYFAYGFGVSAFLAFPLVAFGLLRRAFRAGFEVSMD